MIPQLVFWFFAAMAVLGGLGVILSREPIKSVLSLVIVMLALSVEFLLLSAQFVFAVQVIVYAGAVMVLFLFVVALLGPIKEGPAQSLRFQWWLAIPVVAVFFGVIWAELGGIRYHQPVQGADLKVFGSVQQIAQGLFTTFLFPFELTSVMLLVAAIGAIYLSRRTSDEEPDV